MGCFLLPGAAAVIAGGSLQKYYTASAEHKLAFRQMDWPGTHSIQKKSDKARVSFLYEFGVFTFHFAQLAPILFLLKQTNKQAIWNSNGTKYM